MLLIISHTMKHTFVYIICIIFSCSYNNHAQSILQENILATIGNKQISEVEFLERIELTPQFRKQIKRLTPSLKLEFLYTIIAEKLWAIEAEKSGIDTTEALRTATSSIEKMFVRDALFKQKIKNKIILTQDDIVEGTIRNTKIYSVRYIFSSDSSEVTKEYARLQSGIPFDSLIIKRPEYDEQPNIIDVYFGDLVENIEDSLYTLKAGEYTSPVAAEDGWYVFYVYDRHEQYFGTAEEKENAQKKVRKVLENRLGEKIQNKFYREFFSDKKVDVNRELFLLLAKTLEKIFHEKELRRNENSTTLLTLDAYDVVSIRNSIPDSLLEMSFVEYGEAPVSLNQFINDLAFDGFQLEQYDTHELLSKLNTTTRITIERELLAREGYKHNLDQTEEVRKYVSMWRDYYLSQYFISSQIEQVNINDEMARKYYNSGYDTSYYPEKLNIIEVLCSDPDTAQLVYEKALNDVDMRLLASQYNEREWTKATDGEYGFFPVTLFNEISEVAKKLNVGEVSRPVKLKDGYSVIKLIDKKHEIAELPSKTFEELKSRLKRELAYNKQLSSLVDTTAFIANRTNISINGFELSELPVTNLNSFAIRVMGFGGKITAVPLSKPFTEWVQKWLNKPNILP